MAKQPLSVIFLDIDNLKEINDNNGHICGDRIIRKIACILSEHIRSEMESQDRGPLILFPESLIITQAMINDWRIINGLSILINKTVSDIIIGL